MSEVPLLLGAVGTRALGLVSGLAVMVTLGSFANPTAAHADDLAGTQLTMTVTGPTSAVYRSADSLTVNVGPADRGATGELLVRSTPTAGGATVVVLDTAHQPVDAAVDVPIVADVSRHYVVTFTSDDTAQWSSPEAQTVDVAVSAAGTIGTLALTPVRAHGSAVRPGAQVYRSFGVWATLRLTDSGGAPIAGEPVTLEQLSDATHAAFTPLRTVKTGADGTVSISVDPWIVTRYRLVYAGSANRFVPTSSWVAIVRPLTPGRPVVAPRGSPQPKVVEPPLGHAVGSGANALISAIPDAVWKTMVGYTWTAGCPLGRAQLAYIQVNYWGFDGNRYRGELVVAKTRAAAFARAFTAIYNMGFPIRSMVRPDRFGHSPRGWPGANDYASMAHDNTYAFNCRYVVGRESARRMSPHAYGYAVDINTWENPDLANDGAHPDAWFLAHRSASYGGVIVKGGLVVRAMRSDGFGWGGTAIGDTQHFDPTLL